MVQLFALFFRTKQNHTLVFFRLGLPRLHRPTKIQTVVRNFPQLLSSYLQTHHCIRAFRISDDCDPTVINKFRISNCIRGIGPDIRWCGNEDGVAGNINWNLLDTVGFTRGAGAPSQDTLNNGNINGKNWMPAECDVSIRPGWFFHEEENEKVKTPEQLFNLYLKSVGRGANFLLNVPADKNGLFTSYDSLTLVEFKKLRDENFKTSLVKQKGVSIATAQSSEEIKVLTDNNLQSYISLGDDYKNNFVEIKFDKPTEVNCVVLQEPIQMGQRVKNFTIRTTNENGSNFEIKKYTLGHKRIVTFPLQTAKSVRIYVTDAKTTPLIGEIDAYKSAEFLTEKKLV